jgi:hypothetical protein
MKTYKFKIKETDYEYNIYIVANNGIEASKIALDFCEERDCSVEKMDCFYDNYSANKQMVFAKFDGNSWLVCGICDLAMQFDTPSLACDEGENYPTFIEMETFEKKGWNNNWHKVSAGLDMYDIHSEYSEDVYLDFYKPIVFV